MNTHDERTTPLVCLNLAPNDKEGHKERIQCYGMRVSRLRRLSVDQTAFKKDGPFPSVDTYKIPLALQSNAVREPNKKFVSLLLLKKKK